ncbi:hypothetical protein GIX45_29560 [Erwinia sp. CPCC 100877]|nr:hypothetical protein [Erwinia sp. CPCC 100877]
MNAILIYNLTLFGVVLLSSFYKIASNSSLRKIIAACIFLIVLMPSVLRGGIGTDVDTYRFIFEHGDYFSGKIEGGYLFINQMVHFLNGKFQWVIVICAFVSYLLIFRSVNREFFPVCVIFFTLIMYLPSYSMLRQFIAISFSLYAMRFLVEEKVIKYFLSVVFAMGFHFSALLLIPFYFLRNLKIKGEWLFVASIVICVIISRVDVIDILFQLPIINSTKYSLYADGDFARVPELGSGLGVLLKMIVPVAVILCANKIYRLNNNYSFVVWLNFLYLLATLLSLEIYIFNRVVDVFMFAPVLGVPVLIMLGRDKFSKMSIFALSFLVYFILFEQTINTNVVGSGIGLGINPYQVFWK